MTAKVLKHQSTTILKSMPSRASRAQTNYNEAITCKSSKPSLSTNTDAPSPLEFAKFLPWVCLQFEISIEISVKKAVAEKYTSRRKTSNNPERKLSGRLESFERKAISSDRFKSPERIAPKHVPSSKKMCIPAAPAKPESLTPSDKIPITAYYDVSGQLVEVAIVKSPVIIKQKVIKCINMCLPFHPSLIKLTIIKGGLCSEVLHEIAKMLPLSFITDVCLDDCYVKEGNYYILLDNLSPLKVLSLKRCKINDTVFKEIIKKLDFGQPASGLTVLDLGSNLITDRGVWYLGNVLRRNRSLLHLCLSENKITDIGLNYIMNPLKEFQMSQDEIYGMRKRRFQFIKRIGISKQEKENDPHKHKICNQGTQVHFRGKIATKRSLKKKTPSLDLPKVSLVTLLEREEFTDIFDDHNIVKRDGNIYCIGNLTLCSLNLAYNDLDIRSLKIIVDVLHYQSTIPKTPPCTGLMRLVLEGNLIPQNCDELFEIKLLLSSVISTSQSSTRYLKSRSKF